MILECSKENIKFYSVLKLLLCLLFVFKEKNCFIINRDIITDDEIAYYAFNSIFCTFKKHQSIYPKVVKNFEKFIKVLKKKI